MNASETEFEFMHQLLSGNIAALRNALCSDKYSGVIKTDLSLYTFCYHSH